MWGVWFPVVLFFYWFVALVLSLALAAGLTFDVKYHHMWFPASIAFCLAMWLFYILACRLGLVL